MNYRSDPWSLGGTVGPN